LPTLLLEIGCEELPASACMEAETQLPDLCRTQLGREPSQVLVGPRRLAVLVHELPERTPDESRRGPAERAAYDEEGRPTKAAEGFARGLGLDVTHLERREGHVWGTVPGVAIGEVMGERIAAIVRGLTFRKSMAWRAGGMRFSRPVRWICVKLDHETVAVELPEIPSGGVTYGHRFTHPSGIDVPSAAAYPAVLREAGVEPFAEARRQTILRDLDAIGGWRDPARVLDEVVYLVESPIVLEGSFDERYLALPPRVVETAMQSHQRYFPLAGNRFALVANGGDPRLVREGNERVLEGRLEDASFTFERDLTLGIQGLLERLPRITFVAGAGSMADKSARLERLVEALGGGEASREAARLAKADQAAELVREFPDLEGHVGAEYARLAGYPEAVCRAIEEQYLPDSAGGPLPESEAGRLLAVAERVDNLTVAFSLGERPTGTRDPFGLRRAAIGLCRLAMASGFPIEIPALVQLAHRLLVEQGAEVSEEPPDDVHDFVVERLEGLLDVPVELVRAARGSAMTELGQVAELATALAALEPSRLERLRTVYTRAERIVARAPEQDAVAFRPELLVEPAERDVSRIRDEVEAALASSPGFDEAAVAVDRLAEPLERFFEEVLVMAEDAELRRNRLRLLSDLRDLIGAHLGDLAELPG
jgi:tetrameric-type glycyl-tRNA synthetase beta subunit